MSEVKSKKESWRDVPGTTLQASNLGRLRNAEGYKEALSLVWSGREGGRKSPKIVYRGKQIGAAMLICRAWKGLPPTDKHLCTYLDGDRTNLVPSNLKWVTQGEISKASYLRGRRKGVTKPHLSVESVALIRQLFDAGWTRSAIARRLDVNVACISRRLSHAPLSFGLRDVASGVAVEPPPVRELASVPYQGRMISVEEWSRLTGNSKPTFYERLKRGMTREEAAHAPKFYNRKNSNKE